MIFQNRYQQAIKFLNTIIPKNSSLQVLKAIKVSQKKESITYEATDLDNFLRVRLPLWGDIEGEYGIDAKLLSKAPKMIASKIYDSKVHFGNVILPAFDLKEFPSLETGFFKNPVWEHSSFSKKAFLNAGRRACNYAAANGMSRGVLEGVCIRGGFFYATNGNYLLRCRVGLKLKKGLEFVVPCSFFRLISNDFVIDDVIDLSVHMPNKESGYIVARGTSFELVSKLIEGEYPSIDKILPKEMPYSFTLERQQFLDVAKKAVVFANQKNYMAEIIPQKNSGEFLMWGIHLNTPDFLVNFIKQQALCKLSL